MSTQSGNQARTPEDIKGIQNYGFTNGGEDIDNHQDCRRNHESSIANSVDASLHRNSFVKESKEWGARHTLCLLLFFANVAAFLTRVSISIAIVSMVSSNDSITLTNMTDVCPFNNNTLEDDGDVEEGEFDWDEETQGHILGCYYYGYLISNFVGGLLTERLGGRFMLTVTILGSSLLSLVSPICARTSLGLFIAVRVLSGLTQGPLMCSMFSLMASWIPPQEKAKLCSLSLTGGYVGTVLSMSLGGLMIGSGFLGGWPSLFYIFGIFGVLWTIPWLLLIHDIPDDHPRISSTELSYIKANKSTLKATKRVQVPWKDIATSVPFWSLMAIAWGNNFGFYSLLTEIPTYLKNIQHFGITHNGFLSSLPYIISAIFCIAWGMFADYLLAKEALSIIQVRKLSSGVAMFVPALGLITMCFVDCNSTLAVICLCISVGANAAAYCGGDITEQEIAPNLAGALKGITNTVGSLTGIVAPLITGAITRGNQTLSAWRTVFSISTLTYVITCTIYLIFGTVKVQPWNEPKKKKEDPETERY